MTPVDGDRSLRRPLLIVGSAAGAAIVIVAALLGGMVIGRASIPVAEVPSSSTPTVIAQEPDLPPLPTLGVQSTQVAADTLFTPDTQLSDDDGRANGYRVVDTDVDRRALAVTLAETLNVPGEPVPDEVGGWQVGGVLAGDSSVTVAADVQASWAYLGPNAGVIGQVPAKDEVQQQGQTLLRSLGVQADLVDWQVDVGESQTTVIAWQTIGGQRTQLSWQVSIGRRGVIVAATGFAGVLELVPGYPIVGAASAVDRSARPGWSALGPTLIPDIGATVTAGAEGSPTTPVEQLGSGTPTGTSPTRFGRPVAVSSIRLLTVTEATIGLAQFNQPDGELLLLPAYALQTDDGSRWTILAIADYYVSFQDPVTSATPSATPPAVPSR